MRPGAHGRRRRARPDAAARPTAARRAARDRRGRSSWTTSAARSTGSPPRSCASAGTRRTPSTRCGSRVGACAAPSPPIGTCWTGSAPTRSPTALRDLGRRLAPARDAEVLRETIDAELAALPSELLLGPVRAEATRHFARVESEARAAVLAALDSPEHRALRDALDDLLDRPPLNRSARRPAEKELQARSTVRRLRRAMSAALDGGDDTALHTARKAAKRLRYAQEVTGARRRGSEEAAAGVGPPPGRRSSPGRCCASWGRLRRTASASACCGAGPRTAPPRSRPSCPRCGGGPARSSGDVPRSGRGLPRPDRRPAPHRVPPGARARVDLPGARVPRRDRRAGPPRPRRGGPARGGAAT